MEYDLTRLGGNQFAHLSADLIERVLGFKVPKDDIRGNLVSILNGRIAWPIGPTQQVWQGQAHVESIFFSGPSSQVNKNLVALKTRIETQLNEWEKFPEKLMWRGAKIEYLIYICNAELGFSFGSDVESRINHIIHSRQGLGIKGFSVWDYGRICRLLDEHVQIRRKFAGYISPNGVLVNLTSFAGLASDDTGEIIAQQLAMDLIADQWVRLGQFASPDRQKLALSNVAIDLPILRDADHAFAAEHILSVGNRVLRSGRNKEDFPPHLVLIGGPGQGKTTIGQLVCQVYRTLLLDSDSYLSDESSNLVASVQQALTRVGLSPPANRRWPIRIELAAYADEDTKNNVSLLKYIASQVSLRSSYDASTATMREWLKCWPWLVVLDGLDEVPSQGARDSLVQRISDLFVEASRADCDLLVVATTRPQGYTGELSADRYEHLVLAPLEPDIAAGYAKRLAEVQHSSDPDLLQKLVARTSAASREESTARLMRTPLQVTIMSLLLANRERVPSARYQLFEAYYQAIYSRESTKPGALGALLENLRSHIYALHDRLGLLLQAKAEGAGESDATLPQEELRALARTRLLSEGYSDQEADRLAAHVIKAVIQRLVLIVPKGIDEVGFEIRSIQEFMAARALVSGRDETVLSRLRSVAPSSYWRNTWLFAAGRIFAEREHLRRDLIAIVEDIDNDDIVNVVVAPGADLALDMLDDDLTTGTPGLQRALARHALTLLHYPADEELKRRADVLYHCSSDSVVRTAIDQAVEDCLKGKNAERLGAYSLLEIWQKETGSLGLRSRQLLARRLLSNAQDPSIKPWEKHRQDKAGQTIWDVIEATLQEDDLTAEHRSLIKSGINGIIIRDSRDGNAGEIVEVLENPTCADSLGRVVLSLMSEYPSVASKLRSIMRNWRNRLPASDEVLELTPYPDGSTL